MSTIEDDWRSPSSAMLKRNLSESDVTDADQQPATSSSPPAISLQTINSAHFTPQQQSLEDDSMLSTPLDPVFLLYHKDRSTGSPGQRRRRQGLAAQSNAPQSSNTKQSPLSASKPFDANASSTSISSADLPSENNMMEILNRVAPSPYLRAPSAAASPSRKLVDKENASPPSRTKYGISLTDIRHTVKPSSLAFRDIPDPKTTRGDKVIFASKRPTDQSTTTNGSFPFFTPSSVLGTPLTSTPKVEAAQSGSSSQMNETKQAASAVPAKASLLGVFPSPQNSLEYYGEDDDDHSLLFSNEKHRQSWPSEGVIDTSSPNNFGRRSAPNPMHIPQLFLSNSTESHPSAAPSSPNPVGLLSILGASQSTLNSETVNEPSPWSHSLPSLSPSPSPMASPDKPIAGAVDDDLGQNDPPDILLSKIQYPQHQSDQVRQETDPNDESMVDPSPAKPVGRVHLDNANPLAPVNSWRASPIVRITHDMFQEDSPRPNESPSDSVTTSDHMMTSNQSIGESSNDDSLSYATSVDRSEYMGQSLLGAAAAAYHGNFVTDSDNEMAEIPLHQDLRDEDLLRMYSMTSHVMGRAQSRRGFQDISESLDAPYDPDLESGYKSRGTSSDGSVQRSGIIAPWDAKSESSGYDSEDTYGGLRQAPAFDEDMPFQNEMRSSVVPNVTDDGYCAQFIPSLQAQSSPGQQPSVGSSMASRSRISNWFAPSIPPEPKEVTEEEPDGTISGNSNGTSAMYTATRNRNKVMACCCRRIVIVFILLLLILFGLTVYFVNRRRDDGPASSQISVTPPTGSRGFAFPTMMPSGLIATPAPSSTSSPSMPPSSSQQTNAPTTFDYNDNTTDTSLPTSAENVVSTKPSAVPTFAPSSSSSFSPSTSSGSDTFTTLPTSSGNSDSVKPSEFPSPAPSLLYSMPPSPMSLSPSQASFAPSKASFEPSEATLEPSEITIAPSEASFTPTEASLAPSEVTLEPSTAGSSSPSAAPSWTRIAVDDGAWTGSIEGAFMWQQGGNEDGIRLRVLSAVEDMWKPFVTQSVEDWNQAAAVDLALEDARHETVCTPVTGAIKLCNGNYGITRWRGLALLFLSGNQIIASSIRLNDYYATSAGWDQYNVCHQMGHALGLDHLEGVNVNDIVNQNCMSLSMGEPASNFLSPGEISFIELQSLYGQLQRRNLNSEANSAHSDDKLDPNTVRVVQFQL